MSSVNSRFTIPRPAFANPFRARSRLDVALLLAWIALSSNEQGMQLREMIY